MKVIITIDDIDVDYWTLRFQSHEIGQQSGISEYAFNTMGEDQQVMMLSVMIKNVFQMFRDYRSKELEEFLKEVR